MGRTIIVGDVHGMRLELKALLAKVDLTRADTLVFVGDLLDKGPDSVGVVQDVRRLKEEGFKVVLVMGNHEEKHARFRYALAKNPKPDMKGADGMMAITKGLLLEDSVFLETAVLLHRIPEHNALVVHAGVTPSMTELPTDGVLNARSDALKAYKDVLRVRYVTCRPNTKLTVELEVDAEVEEEEGRPVSDVVAETPWRKYTILKKTVRPAGAFVQLGAEKPSDVFWADIYDGRFGHVYFGHNPFIEPLAAPTVEVEPKRFAHATGLDLGCVFGGYLMAAVLDVGRKPSFVAVPAHKQYAHGFWEDDVA